MSKFRKLIGIILFLCLMVSLLPGSALATVRGSERQNSSGGSDKKGESAAAEEQSNSGATGDKSEGSENSEATEKNKCSLSIRKYMDKESEISSFRLNQLLELVPYGFNDTAEYKIEYRLTAENDKAEYILHIYNNPDMLSNEETTVILPRGDKSVSEEIINTEEGVQKLYCSVSEVRDEDELSEKPVEVDGLSGLTLTVTVTDLNNPEKTTKASVTGFQPADIKSDLEGVSLLVFEGESVQLQDQLAHSGINEVLWEKYVTENTISKAREIAAVSGNVITGVKSGSTAISTKIITTQGSDENDTQTTAAETKLLVIDRPASTSDGRIIVRNVPLGVSIKVDEQYKTASVEGEELEFTGLTQNKEYKVYAGKSYGTSDFIAFTEAIVKIPSEVSINMIVDPDYSFGAVSYFLERRGSEETINVTASPTEGNKVVTVGYCYREKIGAAETTGLMACAENSCYTLERPSSIVGAITVTVKFADASIHAVSVDIKPGRIEKYVGETHQLVTSVLPENTTNKKVIWNSTRRDVVSIDQNGKITVLKYSSTPVIITATSEDNKEIVGSCEIVTRKNIDSFCKKPNSADLTIIYGEAPKLPELKLASGRTSAIKYSYEGRDGTKYGPNKYPPTEVGKYNLVIWAEKDGAYKKVKEERIPFEVLAK